MESFGMGGIPIMPNDTLKISRALSF
ncbi:hypothetical protein BLAT2472_50052 [Burkholderia latens]